MRFMRSLSICVALLSVRRAREDYGPRPTLARVGGHAWPAHDPLANPQSTIFGFKKWRAQPAFRARSTCRLPGDARAVHRVRAGHYCIVRTERCSARRSSTSPPRVYRREAGLISFRLPIRTTPRTVLFSCISSRHTARRGYCRGAVSDVLDQSECFETPGVEVIGFPTRGQQSLRRPRGVRAGGHASTCPPATEAGATTNSATLRMHIAPLARCCVST